MSDFLGRDQAPLTQEQWKAFDDVVVSIARRTLVGRRMLNIFGPLGPGYQVAPNDRFAGRTVGAIDMLGEADCNEIAGSGRVYLPLPILHKDFMIHWRDLEEANQTGMPLDTGAVASAAAYCARLEDEIIFNGHQEMGYDGLRTVAGRMTVQQSDWSVMGNAFRDVTNAVEQLSSNGFTGPFAVAVSPRMLVAMNRMFENTGVLESDQVRKLATAGIYVTPVLPDPSIVVVATGPENLDLVMGLDMTTSFLTTDKMNHHFRVLETLVLRLKRPEAICTIEGAGITQPAAPTGRRAR
ncbi:MAG TPA: family 1 encapsulin nanocompartment shell protein [Chloroflexota bacterium]|nr:family 1 encapsulin nanocompartment shell protein [Chloroflexota bacterium]